MSEAFLGLDVSLEAVEQLVLIQEDLAPVVRARGGVARWVEAPEMRLVLKALGPLDPALYYDVCETVGKLASSLVPFKVSLQGVCFDPDPRRPRLVLARVGLGAELIGSLRQVLDGHLGALGLPVDPRPFEPVVQLGRVLTPGGPVDLTDVAAELRDLDFGESYVKNVMLSQTSQAERGPQRLVHRRFILGL